MTPEYVLNRIMKCKPNVRYTSAMEPTEMGPGCAVIVDHGETGAWVKAAAEAALPDGPVFCVVPVRTNTRYWHKYILNNKHAEVHFVEGRLVFPGHSTQSPSASAVVHFKAPFDIACDGRARLFSHRPRTVAF